MENFANLFSSAWSILLVVIFFGGSIFVHELGHFLAARRRGLKVDRFSIGFGPKIFAWKGKDGVEYRLSWLPLGGYVSLPQLADMRAIEGTPSAETKRLPEPSYSTKVIVFAAGAVFNVIFAVTLAFILWGVGIPTSSEQTSTTIGYIAPEIPGENEKLVTSPAVEAGLKIGDKIVAIDGRQMHAWNDITESLVIGSGRTNDQKRLAVFTIERDGKTQDIQVHPQLSGTEQTRKIGIGPAYELIVESVKTETPAAIAGFQKQDRIVSFNGVTILNAQVYFDYLIKNRAAPVAVVIKRGEATQTLTLPAHSDAEVKLAATSKEKDTVFSDIGLSLTTDLTTTYPNPFRQIADNATRLFRTFSSLVNRHSDVGISKLSGPAGIARVYYMAAQSDFRYVLWFTIVVNVNLALMNLLPIPVLDGGHILFATIARLRGRALPYEFIATTQSVFMVLLFSMILYVSFFDVRRWTRDSAAERPKQSEPAKATEPTPTPTPAK